MKQILLCLLLLIGCSSKAEFIPEYEYGIETLESLVAEQEANMEAAHQMAEAARQLGYEESHDVIQLASEEYNKAYEARKEYLEALNQQKEEYSIASYIWNYLRELGYSKEVTAGILGNMMTEAGRNTLNIQYNADNGQHYGICQWSKKYYPEIVGVSLEEQCNFLRDTIEYELDTFGCGYGRFVALTDVEQVAKYFAQGYERSGTSGYEVRQQNAIIAYNYFG